MAPPEYSGTTISRGSVLPEWIDINGHMNVAYYVAAFDKAVDDLFKRLGVTDSYIHSTGGSTFAVESHVTWQRELKEGEPYRIDTQILAYDEKRVHQVQRMFHADEHYLAATAEWMNLHVDLKVRKVSAWPAFVLQALAAFTVAQSGQMPPREVSRRMQVARPIYSLRPVDGDG